MKRRSFLQVGLAATLVVATTGGIALVVRARPWADDRLSPSGRAIFAALARGILDGTLAADPAVADRQIEAHLERIELAVRQFPPALQSELSQLLAVLDTPPGRRWLFTMDVPWSLAAATDVQQALERLRMSPRALRRQTYHALRDLTNAAYYSEPGTWAALGYPGPIPI